MGAIVGDRIAVTPQRGGDWRVCGVRLWASLRPSHRGRLFSPHFALPGESDFRPTPARQAAYHCETFADPLLLPRGERQQALKTLSTTTPRVWNITRSSRP